jgi:hypothetical protein
MTPAAALENQIDRYRRLTGDERLQIALRLHELSCEVARDGIRSQNPSLDADGVETQLRERIRLTYAS